MNRPTLLTLLLLAALTPAHSQYSNSGSTGADGALFFTTPGTTLFDPAAFTPPLNPAANNIFHFTSIHIGKGVVLKLSSKLLHSPVFWLAQGPVEINGTIDLDGADGAPTPALAGAGGYPGGSPGKPGYRPGAFKSNVFLVPLFGGSGGGGGETQGGGAGGGALLIASSTSITVNGFITANGGASSGGTGGNGGAIRLVARSIGGSGTLAAKGGQPGGADGLVRFEAFENQFAGSLRSTPFVQGKPFGLFLPPDPPASVRVLSAAGAVINNGEITVHAGQSSQVLLVVEARFIPPDTVIQMEFFMEHGTTQVISTTPLAGTFELSHATVSATLPPGLHHAQVAASWKQPK
jgi:hypothetical protein